MQSSQYVLRPPQDHGEWRSYHAIRRKVLFDTRGHAYDEHHPDEFRPGNHPLVLFHRGEPVGVIRIDIDPPIAIFRRVAIREDVQRHGHGTVMLRLAERFACDIGCNVIQSFVNPEAVTFYERCGFNQDEPSLSDAHHVPMRKVAKTLQPGQRSAEM
jgi:GNAT superfamily N-acetyltransferase